MAKNKDKRNPENQRPGRTDDCGECNKGQWNLTLKVVTGGAVAFLVSGILWGWAAWASSEKVNHLNARLSMAEQMIIDDRISRDKQLIDDRAAREKQTKIIERIEGYSENRNLMLYQAFHELGIKIKLPPRKPKN